MESYSVDNYRVPVEGATGGINREVARVRKHIVERVSILGLTYFAELVEYEGNRGPEPFVVLHDEITSEEEAWEKARTEAMRHNSAILEGHRAEANRLLRNADALLAELEKTDGK